VNGGHERGVQSKSIREMLARGRELAALFFQTAEVKESGCDRRGSLVRGTKFSGEKKESEDARRNAPSPGNRMRTA